MKIGILSLALGAAAAFAASPPCTGDIPPATVDLPGAPFKLAVSSDGCTIYASIVTRNPGLAILQRTPEGVSVSKLIKTAGRPTGLVLTHDGKLLIATSGKSVLFIDPIRGAVIHKIDEQAGDEKVYVNITRDDKTLFVSNERSHSISVIDVPSRKVKKRIETGNAPIALTFSPDERFLYTTSQSATPDWNWPAVCDSENEALRPGKHPKGAILIIDVATATVTSRVEAGCNPVRLALSPDGMRAYVTTRKDNAVVVFETAKFTRIAEIAVGSAPVPLAVVDEGKTILVGNSNRFGVDGGRASLTVIDAATLKVVGTTESGTFPRDIVTSPDGRTVYVANYGPSSMQIMRTAGLRTP